MGASAICTAFVGTPSLRQLHFFPTLLPMVAFLLLLTGCANNLGKYEYFMAEGMQNGDAIKKLVIVPMNMDAPPPEYMVEGVESLEQQMRDELEQTGRIIERPALKDVSKLRNKITQEKMAEHSVDPSKFTKAILLEIRQDIARRLSAQYGADAVVFSTVVLRKGKSFGRTAFWDGVSRKQILEISGKYSQIFFRMSGACTGTSLWLDIYDSNGKKIFENYGGLELVHRYEVIDMMYRAIKRTDFFEDEMLLKDGISVALNPFIIIKSDLVQ